MKVWTLAYHNRTGTGAYLFAEDVDAYSALINLVVNPSDSESLTTAKKMLLLRQFEELCAYLQKYHFGELDDYSVQSHELTLTASFGEGR